MRFVQAGVLLLGAVMYIAIIESFSGDSDVTWMLVMVGGWNLAMLIATVIAVVDSVSRIRGKKPRQLAVDALVVKLASIPFFLLNFAVLTFLFNASIVLIFIGPFLWTIIAIGILLTYLTMLSTSVYAWATITQLRRERIIGTKLTVLYTTLCFLFVTDIAAAILLFGHSRRRPRLALVWLLLGSGLAMIMLGVLDIRFRFLEGILPELSYFHVAWLEWFIPIVVGIVVIVATVIVSVVRRSTLRTEARAARPTQSSIDGEQPA